jgi:hypothetical protein
MLDETSMRLMLERMERAAEEALQGDSSFYEALHALKWEVDRDSRVQSAISSLQNAGSKAFSSFVPHIKIRIRTREGIVSLPPRVSVETTPEVEQVAQLTRELRNAARAVISKSRYRAELDSIVNEAVRASGRFEGIATEIESAGHEVVICLDLTSYAQVREPARRISQMRISAAHQEPHTFLFSAQDLRFLKALKIKTTEG